MKHQCYACEKKMERFAKMGAFAVAVKGEGIDHLYTVGGDCYKRIEAAGKQGYQPPKGGPVLITYFHEKDSL